MGYYHHRCKCKKRCDCHKRKPDIVLKPTLAAGRSQEEPYPLPMLTRTCKYELVGGFSSPPGNEGLILKTLKKGRELVVKVKVATNIKIEISIQTGTETPRIITFENISEKVKFVEELKKGDVITFFQTYTGQTPVNLDFKVLIKKRCYH